jgi:hypothetical protein
MPTKAKPSKGSNISSLTPYSEWSNDVLNRIKNLSDECLDRFKEDKKINSEILIMLSKLQTLIEKKYSE